MNDRAIHTTTVEPCPEMQFLADAIPREAWKDILGRYEIQSCLGQGTFGIAYCCLDKNLQRRVAIKEFFPQGLVTRRGNCLSLRPEKRGNYEDFKKQCLRFRQEAQILAALNHPNIVRVLDIFYRTETKTFYMVMNYVEGQCLDKMLSKFRDEKLLLELLHKLLDGLEQAHHRGLIHRDIKPLNIFIQDDDSPVLLDFGAARYIHDEEMTIMLSPNYAPPEQLVENTGFQIGPWSDIYALGSVLYFIVTGNKPVPAAQRINPDSITHSGRGYPTDALLANATNFSLELLNAVDRAMRYDPAARPRSIQAWRKLLPPPSTPLRIVDPEEVLDRLASYQPQSQEYVDFITAAKPVFADDINKQRTLVNLLKGHYLKQDRNLVILDRQITGVQALFPIDLNNSKLPIGMRMDWIIALFTLANHFGNPEQVRALVADIENIMADARKDVPELVAEFGLFLAVHYFDCFEFAKAEELLRSLLPKSGRDALFLADWRTIFAKKSTPKLLDSPEGISRLQEGRLWSSLGQAFALRKKFIPAIACFKHGIDLLAQQQVLAEEEKPREINKTRSYQAIVAMDAGLPEAEALVIDVLGQDISKAVDNILAVDRPASPYHHFLLLRAIHFLPASRNVARALAKYWQKRGQWTSGTLQHPWELIHLYRGIICYEENEFAFGDKWFEESYQLASSSDDSATLHLLAAMIVTVWTCACHGVHREEPAVLRWYRDNVTKSLPTISEKLPATIKIVEKLRGLLHHPSGNSVDLALTTLPFYYH